MDSDILLIEQYKSGNADVFGQLYDKYFKPIYSFVYFRTSHKETAEDLTSQIFMKALEHLRNFSEAKGTFKSWLYRIARNTVIDHYRTSKKDLDIDAIEDAHDSTDIPHEVEHRLLLEKVRAQLAKLPDDQQELVTLRVYSGLSYKEIAAVIGKTEASAKMAFSRIVSLLRESLALLILYAFITIGKLS
jgi:RNA polymerase sigma-70 factor (ECF subfamily)